MVSDLNNTAKPDTSERSGQPPRDALDDSSAHGQERFPNPAVLLFLLLLLLSLSFLYPQEAYPLRAVPLAYGLVLLGGVGLYQLLAHLTGKGIVRWLGLALGIAWPAWYIVRLFGAPVAALAEPEAVDIIQGSLVFLSAAGLLVWWNGQNRVLPLRLAAGWFAAIAMILALHGLYQHWGPDSLPGTHAAMAAELEAHPEVFPPQLREGMLHALREGRASGRIGSSNIFAGLLAIALPVCITLFIAQKNRWRWLFAAGAPILFVAIIATSSRGGLLSALFGLFVLTVLLFARRKLFMTHIAAVLIAVCILGATGNETNQSELSSRWFGITTVQQRFYYWESAISIWSDNWIAGKGPGAFALYYTANRRPGAQETGFAHSWLFQWGSETGAVGILLFALWPLTILIRALRNRREQLRETSVTEIGIIAALLVTLAGGLIEFTLSYREVYLSFAFLTGALYASSFSNDKIHSRKQNGAILVGSILFCVCMGGLLFQTHTRYAFAEHYTMISEDVQDFQESLDWINKAIAWQPKDAALYESRGLVRMRLGDPRAVDDLKRALNLHPTSARLHQTMGRYHLAIGDLAGAIEWQEKAIELHPLDPNHRLEMADYLLKANRPEQARAMYESATELLLDNEAEMRIENLRPRIETNLPERSVPTPPEH